MAETDAAAVLVTIALDLPKIGVRGEAVVTGVEPCPVILPGPGKVVLTTFHHASSDLIDLYLSPQPPTGSLTAQQSAVDALLYPQVSRASVVDQAWERIGVTGNHPIWSEDRHDYVAAMDLRVGERLKNLSGDTVWVQQKLPRPGPTPVYNLEVQDEHVYYVGANGVLAHNSTECDAPVSAAKPRLNILNPHFTPNPLRVLQNVTNQAVSDLHQNPSIARNLMSAGSYRHLVQRTNLADASYGKAVERLAADIVKKDTMLSSILKHQSRPFRSTPDFFGYEGYNLHLIDITTLKSVPHHLKRSYGSVTNYVIHPGLPQGLMFPK